MEEEQTILENAAKQALDGKMDFGLISVIEPINYDMRELKFMYPKFGFVISSIDKIWFDVVVKEIENHLEFFSNSTLLIDGDALTDKVKSFLDCKQHNSNTKEQVRWLVTLLDIYLQNVMLGVNGAHLKTFVTESNFKVLGKRDVNHFYVGTEKLLPEKIQSLAKKKYDMVVKEPMKYDGTHSLIVAFTKLNDK